MKLDIGFEYGHWYCHLEYGTWIGYGESPSDAFNDYIKMVIKKDIPNSDHADYEWCKSKGLIK